jgi:hypothetical protein
LQPVGRWHHGADEILDTHDYHRRFPAPLNYEAFVILYRSIHALSELSA